MNKGLIEQIKEGKSEELLHIDNLEMAFINFLEDNSIDSTVKVKATGKNFGTFDLKFINKVFKRVKFHHRVLDVGSLMVNFKNDEWLPGLLECKKRAGIKGEVTHNALEDCWDVIEILRTKYER